MESLLLYLAIFLISALLSLISVKRGSKMAGIFAVLVPALFIGIRYNVGTDYAAYEYTFNLFADMHISDFIQITDDTRIEIGFYAIIRIANLLFHDAWGMFMISALLSLSIAYYAIDKLSKKNTPMVYMLYLLIVTPFIMNGVRQGIAISIIYLAITYIVSGNVKKYILCVIIGYLFHSSALVLLPMYFLRSLIVRSNKGKFIDTLTTLMPALFIGLGMPLILLISPHVPILNQYLGYTGALAGISPVTLTMKLTVVLLVLLTLSRLSSKYPETRLFASMAILELVFISLGTISGVFARLQFYVSIAGLLYIARMPDIFSANTRNIVRFIIACYGIAYFILAYYIAGYSNIFPYQIVRLII